MKSVFKQILSVFVSIIILICPLAAVYSSALTDYSVSYVFTGDEADKAGFAQGEITITPATNSSDSGFYLVYYTDGVNTLKNYDELASAAITGSKVKLTVKDGAMIPADAKGIAVFESDTAFLTDAPDISSAVATSLFPTEKLLTLGTPELTFAAASDVHMNYEYYNRGAYRKWADALEFFSDSGSELVVVTGDLTGDTDLEAEYAKYIEIINASSVDVSKVYESVGNHGNTPSDLAIFNEYTAGSDEIHPFEGSAYYHILVEGKTDAASDNLFIFMAQELQSPGDSALYDNFSKEQIDWLEGLLTKYGNTDTNIFIIEHSPFLNFGAGDRHYGNGYSALVTFDPEFTQTMRLKSLLETYKDAIVMSGHTHLTYYENENYSDEYNSFARTVHVSSTCYPAGYNGGTSYTQGVDGRQTVNSTYGSEAYIVDVYADYIVYTGYNLSTGKIIPAACILLPTKAYGGSTTPENAVLTPDEAFTGGGTEENPYRIEDAEDFMLLTNMFNASTTSTESEMFGYGMYFLQTADIDMTSVTGYSGTYANGNAKCYFAGKYNGNGHSLTVDINDTYQRSVFPYVYGEIVNTIIKGSISADYSAQPIRTLYGRIVNCVFDLTLSAQFTNGMVYSNYGTLINVYSHGALNGDTNHPIAASDSSTDYTNVYYSFGDVTDQYGVKSNDLTAIASAFNSQSDAIIPYALKVRAVADQPNLLAEHQSFDSPAEIPEDLFWFTHINNNTAEGAGVIFTENYTGAGWWLHLAFEPSDLGYKLTAIENGLGTGAAKPLAVPENGFVYCLNYGNDYPSLGLGDINYRNAYVEAMIETALSWSVGDVITLYGVDIDDLSVPNSTPTRVWYDPYYSCTATFELIYDATEDNSSEESSVEDSSEGSSEDPSEDSSAEDSSNEPSVEPDHDEKTLWLTHYNDLTAEGAGVIVTDNTVKNSPWNDYYAFAPVTGTVAYELVATSYGNGTGVGAMPDLPEGGFIYSINMGNNYPALYESDPVLYEGCKNMPDYTSDNCFNMIADAKTWKLSDRFVFYGIDLNGVNIPTSTPELYWYEDGYISTASYALYDPNGVYPEPDTSEDPSVEDTSTEDSSDYIENESSEDSSGNASNDSDNIESSDNSSDGSSEDSSDVIDEYEVGDVNADGSVDQLDYLLVKRAYFGTYVLDTDQQKRADVDYTGAVDQVDYVLIKRVYFGTYIITKKQL